MEHRGALALVAEADEQRGELEGLLGRGEDDGVVAAASAARFGYGQALLSWSECAPARRGFDAATAPYAVWCANRGDLVTAEGLRDQLHSPNPDVDAAVEAARERERAEAERRRGLERLGHELDARTGQRTRLIVVGIILLTWIASPLIVVRWDQLMTYTVLLAQPVLSIAVIAGLVAWGRESMLATRVNRRGMATFVFMLLAQLLISWGGYRQGLPFDSTMANVFSVWSLTAALFALTVEPRFWPGAAAYVLGGVVVTAIPSVWPWTSSLCNLAVFANAIVVWKPGVSVAPSEVPDTE